MVKSSQVLALIPARGGSKSIPRKNIRLFAGVPLLAYSIRAGLAAGSVDRVVVSTDDEEIAAIARQYGAETPFLRPPALSGDETPDLPVFQHALSWLSEQEGFIPEVVVQLRPTSPFRRVQHIDQAVKALLERPEADAVRTVCVPFQNPFKMWCIAEDGFMHPLIQTSLSEAYNMPRQILPTVYWQTGYVDAARSSTILKKNSMTGENILPLVIDPSEWIDIDSPDDWRRAERLLESGEITPDYLGFDLKKSEQYRESTHAND
jgi:CMP-N-acetylneuraminic acid synthetase